MSLNNEPHFITGLVVNLRPPDGCSVPDRVSPKTLLTFCTSGVLLRTLMGGDGALATVTHGKTSDSR